MTISAARLRAPRRARVLDVRFAFAFPGEETMYPEGETILAQPGRYALVCFIPVGADVAKLKEAVAAQEEGAEGPPEMGDGPPHRTKGMTAQIVVS